MIIAPDVIPNWIADQGCTDVLVGGIDEAAQIFLQQLGIKASAVSHQAFQKT